MRFNSKRASELVDACPIKEKVIADKCTIEVKTLQQYLRGNGKPSAPVLRLLAQVLEVPESELTINDSDSSKAS